MMRSLPFSPPKKRGGFPWGRFLPGTVLLAFLLGCGEPAQIQEYTVPKTTKPQEQPLNAKPRPASGQMGMPTYDVPPEWSQVENKPLSLATFQVSKADQEAFVTIIPLGLLTEELLLPNLNRWRGQVSLPPLDPGEPVDSIEDIRLGDSSGRYLKLVGEKASEDQQAMLMMFADHAGRTWYFKLFGDAELVLQEEPRFKTFVQSVRFSPKQEAGDE